MSYTPRIAWAAVALAFLLPRPAAAAPHGWHLVETSASPIKGTLAWDDAATRSTAPVGPTGRPPTSGSPTAATVGSC